MSQIRRTKRLASLLRAELGKLALEELSDPILGGMAVTEVLVTADLKRAKVFFNVPGETAAPDIAVTPEDRGKRSGTPKKTPRQRELEKALSRITPFFRRRIGEELGLRYVPELEFEEDNHVESVTRLFGLIETARNENAVGIERNVDSGESL